MLEVNGGPGELFRAIIKEQFERLRDSDRFWFENRQNGLFSDEEIGLIHSTTLRDIISGTTGISDKSRFPTKIPILILFWVFVFENGDPCPQPFQVNATDQKFVHIHLWDLNESPLRFRTRAVYTTDEVRSRHRSRRKRDNLHFHTDRDRLHSTE
ncbi:hypothetical protein COOONC_22943 [Cooperia oncophora]